MIRDRLRRAVGVFAVWWHRPRRKSFTALAAGIAMAMVAAVVSVGAVPAAAAVNPPPPFHECPAVGNATGCAVLLVFQSDGTVSVLSDPNSGNPYDGADDTEVGVLNEAGVAIPNVTLNSGADIFGFDGDGICSGGFSGTPAGCPFDTTKYGGPGISYSGINAAKTAGVVNFAASCTGNTASTCSPSAGLNDGASAFFSLEANVTGASIIIPKASPVISSTTPSPATTVGGAISDSAALANGRVPTGTLTFKLYGPGDTSCQNAISTLTTAVNGNGTYPSGTVGTSAPGTYSWTVSYGGDANNNPAPTTACGSETVTVSKAGPSLATTPSASVPVGGTVSDTGVLSGGFNPAGTLTFKLYAPGDTSCQSAISTLTATVAGSGSYSSGTVPVTAPGLYNWVAAYSGDANNNGATSACGSETVTVSKASPSLATTPSASVPVGGTVSDTGVLSGGYNPTGTLTFKLYAPGDTSCQSAISTLTATVAGSGSYSSGTVPVTAPGLYNWVAAYSGDANNNGATSACGSETVKVTPQVLTGRAYGLTASASALGLQLLTIAPTPDTGSVSTTTAETVAPPCVVSLSGLINSGTLCASVTTSLSPSKSAVQASVDNTSIGLPGVPVITIGAVQSQSTSTCQAANGSTTIAYLSVGGVVVISKPTAVAPNTKISVAGVNLILNEQLASPGTLTVNAVHVNINALGLNLVTANVVLASSTSDIHNCP